MKAREHQRPQLERNTKEVNPFTSIARKLGFATEESEVLARTEINVRNVQAFMEAAMERRDEAASRLPYLRHRFADAMARGNPAAERGDLDRTEAKIAKLNGEIEHYRDALKLASGYQLAAEQEQITKARQEAKAYAEQAAMALER
jgi:hypothetical protein